MEETRLLIPIIPPPQRERPGKPVEELRVLHKEKGLIAEVRSQNKKGQTSIFQMEIPVQSIPHWENTPILLKGNTSKEYTLEALFLQRERSYRILLSGENPEENQTTLEEGKTLTKEGFLHSVGTRKDLLQKTLTCCQNEIQGNTKDPAVLLAKIQEIIDECKKEETPWSKKKQEFEPSKTLDYWPEGYLESWLNLLDRSRIMEAKKTDMDWIPEQSHSWTFLPETDDFGFQQNKETFCVAPWEPQKVLEARKLTFTAALLLRPEEILGFLCGHPQFQKINQSDESAVTTFLAQWLEKIQPLRGILLPKL